MNKFILSLVFLFSAQAHAFLSSDDATRVLKVIDQTCGDSWCEGAFDIEFSSIRCSKRNSLCLLDLNLKDSFHEGSAMSRTCSIERVRHVDDLVNNLDRDAGLTDTAKNAISECIEQLNAQLK